MNQVGKYGYLDKQYKSFILPSLNKFLLHMQQQREEASRNMDKYSLPGNTRIVTDLRSMLSCLLDRVSLKLIRRDSSTLSRRLCMFLDL